MERLADESDPSCKSFWKIDGQEIFSDHYGRIFEFGLRMLSEEAMAPNYPVVQRLAQDKHATKRQFKPRDRALETKL